MTEAKDYPRFVQALLEIKYVAAFVNTRNKDIPEAEGLRIQAACKKFLALTDWPGYKVDPYSGGGGILLHSYINELLAGEALAGEAQTNSKNLVNCNQSTADVLATAVRLSLFGLCQELVQVMNQSVQSLRSLQRQFAETPLMARTCLQDAMPTTLGTLFEGFAEFTERRKEKLETQQKDLLQIWLGGTVIGSGDGASESYRQQIIPALANHTGLALKPRGSFYDAAQNADDLGELSHSLSLLAQGLIKINKDLRLLASGPQQGLNEIVLAKVIPGSTFFSEKNNPTIPETLIQAGFLVLGRSRTAQAALEHAELNLNVFETSAGFAIYESLEILIKGLKIWNQFALKNISLGTRHE